MKKTGIIYLMTLVAVFTGCKTTPKAAFQDLDPSPAIVVSNKLNPDLLKPSADPFVLGPGDKLELDMQGNGFTRSVATVGLDGKIYFSLLPGIDVTGLTVNEAKVKLEHELSKFLSQPQVNISLKEVGSKHVWVLGRVDKPGTYPLNGPATLLEAISAAGGPAKSASIVTTQNLADLRHSFVMRQGKLLPVDFVRLLEEGDMNQNIYLKPDDFIFLPSAIAQQVYVLGAVLNPRSVPYSDHMTLISAMANVNGYVADAYLTHVAILRGSLNEPHILVVNYKAIIAGKAMDVPLEPGDVVFVPLTPYRFVSDYADLIVTTFVRSWSANMGIRAVSGSSQIGVSVPVTSSRAQ